MRKGAAQGGQIWWVSPTYAIASEAWRDIKRACRRAWTDKSEVERRIQLAGGGSITVKSADNPESLVAVGLDGLVMDEAARCHEQAWKESLRPTLSDKQGWALFISTPRGHNWFYHLWKLAGEGSDWQAWQLPTRQNPLITEAELAAAVLDCGSRLYGQEYEAKFQELEGAEWPASYFGDSIWFDDWPEKLSCRGVALDPSKGKTDRVADSTRGHTGSYSAYVWGGLHDGKLYVDADLDNTRDVRKIVEDGLAILRDFRPDAFGGETVGFQNLLLSEFRRLGRERSIAIGGPWGIPTGGVPKEVRIRRLGSYLANGEIRFKRGSKGCRLLVTQLQEFPQGEHEDGPDALEMLVRLIWRVLKGRRKDDKGQPEIVRA